jgi:hypothetical protein
MDRREKMEMLQKLSEEELTKTFLIPLYDSDGMGCKNVVYTHGILEFGKDIVYYREEEYGNRIYTGVQVKKTKITATSIGNIVRQTLEAFGEPFTNRSDGEKKNLDRFVLLTSNEFTGKAKDSFWAELRGAAALRGDKLDTLVNCVDGNDLVNLLDKHCPSVFVSDSKSILRKFREMLSNSDLKEKDFKQFFVENPWLVGIGYNYAEIVSEPETGKSSGVDLSLETFEHDYDIMILKHHMDSIISGSEDEWRLSEDCESGISQMYRYFEWYEKKMKREDYRSEIEVYKPTGFIVIGQNRSRDIQRKLKLINRYFHSIKILTYDDLYEKAERWTKFQTREGQ